MLISPAFGNTRPLYAISAKDSDSRMTEVDISNGKFNFNGEFFKPQIETESVGSHTVGKNLYSNMSLNGIVKNIPFRATGYYKNKELKSISLTIESEYLKANYHPPKDIDFRDYLTPYVDYWKQLTEELINEMLKSKKRNFSWGKVQVKVDPRNPTVYCEIKYY